MVQDDYRHVVFPVLPPMTVNVVQAVIVLQVTIVLLEPRNRSKWG